MEYHKQRFKDASLLIYDDKHRLTALFVANRQGDKIISHGGLSYGGLIYDNRMTQPFMIKIFQALIAYFITLQVQEVFYKTIPSIYHSGPAEEDRYVLFLLNATLQRRDSLTVVDTQFPISLQNRRSRAMKKAKKRNIQVLCSEDFSGFWRLLEQNLKEKHGVSPVHTVNEMVSLAQSFPDNIKLFSCYDSAELLAGIVVYETEHVAHFQYIAASDIGRQLGALDWLFFVLIQEIYADKRYIDFGVSNEHNGMSLNKGLIDFKEGFGGRTISHDFYYFDVSPTQLHALDRVII